MYISNTDKEREEMLRAIGVSSITELLSQIPQKYLYPEFSLPHDRNNEPLAHQVSGALPHDSLDEMELRSALKKSAAKNTGLLSFVGAGAYERYIPAAVKAVTARGEFLTAYTPYQAEASQGILQSIYEYQSLVCSLFEMEASNASMYDGASALAEAARACVRITSKKQILYSGAVHPHCLETLRTYLGGSGEVVGIASDTCGRGTEPPALDEPEARCSGRSAAVPYEFIKIRVKNGKTDLSVLEKTIGSDTACVIAQSPNFFGVIEDMEEISGIVHKNGALFAASADPVSLGILAPPGSHSADFAVAEGQSLGLPLNYGGPYLGIFTCKKDYIRQMPGRIAGMTRDKDGKRGFVLTIQAREQHIRREKSASNICSNEALCALAAAVYLTLLGPDGIKELALLNAAKASFAADKLSSIKGISLKFKEPFFNEFALELPVNAENLRKALIKSEKIDIGLPLGLFFPEMKNSLLVAATETKTEEDILRLESAIKRYICQ
ncbi:MAG: glycine dehydrogenase [Elusimicrobia bacterium]|nr:glycine dehydrogenase [Elusimicrobiota bacterium]